MPILSLNSHNIPTGTSSYSALGLSGTAAGAGVPPLGAALNHPTLGLDSGALLGTSGLSGLGAGLAGAASFYGLGPGVGSIGAGLPNTFGPPPPSYLDIGSTVSYPFTSAAIRNATKMKMLDEIDIPLTRFGNRSSPCSPIPPSTWGLDEFPDSLSASMMHSRGGLALGPMDMECKYFGIEQNSIFSLINFNCIALSLFLSMFPISFSL